MSSGRDKRLESDHSITIRNNRWFDHSFQKGGRAISFVQMYYDLSYPEAVTMLLGYENIRVPENMEDEVSKTFVLPPANMDTRRVMAYLIKERGISLELLSHFINESLIYEDARYHNAVFVGRDENGVACHAHKRSTNSKGKAFRQNVEGSDPKYSFHYIGSNGSLYVFEAPIDMLSYITLHPNDWQQNNYVACCGTSIKPVLHMFSVTGIDYVELCLDNDLAGRRACEKMSEQLSEVCTVNIRKPLLKDWNEDLCCNSKVESDA